MRGSFRLSRECSSRLCHIMQQHVASEAGVQVISHDHDLTSDDLFDLSTSRIVSFVITKNKGKLHIKWKQKTAALQRKYVSVSLRSNDWPQADHHWPLMTAQNLAFWNICLIKRKLSTHAYHVWQHLFAVLNHMTCHDHDLTSNDLF